MYRVDAALPGTRTAAGARAGRLTWDAQIVLVGVGGTGGFLCEQIARLFQRWRIDLTLVDPDLVERHNVARQNFLPGDEGESKVLALGRRLRPFFPSEGARASRLRLRAAPFQAGDLAPPGGTTMLRIVIGAVDNAAARATIARALGAGDAGEGDDGDDDPDDEGQLARAAHGWWWLDLGNGRTFGQVVLGNALRREGLCGGFEAGTGRCLALPAASLRYPALLRADQAAGDELDCAERILRGEQSATINAAVASAAATMLERLADGELDYAGVLLDQARGTMRPLPLDPDRIGAEFGLARDAVVVGGVA